MTREEMMKQLNRIRDKVTVCSLESTFEDDCNSIAMNMVIELLEQPPCEDAISREKVIDTLKETGIIADNNLGNLVIEEINHIQPVTPTRKTRIKKMDRLTCRYENANVLREQCTFDRLSTDEPDDWVPCCEICEMKYDGTEVCEACPIQIAIDRLAEYENTGLSPEQIENVNNPLPKEIPIELKELLHNLRDRNWDVNPIYRIDENEGKKLVKAIEELVNDKDWR